MSRRCLDHLVTIEPLHVRLSVLFPLLTVLLSLGACGTPQKVSLNLSSNTRDAKPSSPSIPLTVRMDQLVDASPAEDKEDGWIYGSGVSVTSPDRLNGELAALVTDAVATNMRSYGVFGGLTQDQSGTMVLGGRIHRFYQRRENYLWGLCCGLLGLLMPFPLMKEEGEVDLELTLSKTDGTQSKSYRSRTSFLKRCNAYESRCWQPYYNDPAKYLKEALDVSLQEIREAMLKDRLVLLNRVQEGLTRVER